MGLTKRWLTGTLTTGIVVDIVVDAHHAVEYLKYAATWSLLTASGSEKANGQCLSAVSGIMLSASREGRPGSS